MELTSRNIADVVVVAPVGEIDHPNAMKLQEALTPVVDDASARQKPLVLDFTGVEYISSMGLRVLMVAAKQMRSRKAPIAIAGLQPDVEEIFEIARFRFVMDVFPSVRDALVALSAPATAAYDAATNVNRVRFWGTRGSLPVALTASDVRAKVIAALRGAAGRNVRHGRRT